jgi:hypothetical protein
MTTQQLVKAIKVHISKGIQLGAKAEQHYISAGLHLVALKAQHKGDWPSWEKLLKDKIGIGKSRASELMRTGERPSMRFAPTHPTAHKSIRIVSVITEKPRRTRPASASRR